MILVHFPGMSAGGWFGLFGSGRTAERRCTIVTGVDDPDSRARILCMGFGEVAGSISLAELDARARRVAAMAGAIPRLRVHGRLRLDLFLRDGFCNDRRLGLHPREFAVAWRLAETPGEPVGRRQLLSEVWRLSHVPETNSVAVHVSRLRSKLATAGLGAIIETTACGGYRLLPAITPPAFPFSVDSGLDAYLLAGDEGLVAGQEA